MRIHHYLKNILVFVALICSGGLFTYHKFISDMWAFMSFCMLASAIYIINDIGDIENDRKHQTKCNRPIAAGKISIKNAYIFAGLLIVLSLVFNYVVFDVIATCLLAVYFVLNVAYSKGLKNIPIVDISILVSGFLIRIIYGAIISEIKISNWLYLTVIAMAFYLAMGKRRNEMRNLDKKEKTRDVLSLYTVSFLDKNMYMCLALANVFYALWSVDENTALYQNSSLRIWTVPLVILICMKYSYDIEGQSDGDPVEVFVHDKCLIIMCIIYVAVMFFILYIQ
jgi:4-hydroxybenzoate polyprenyltransferase